MLPGVFSSTAQWLLLSWTFAAPKNICVLKLSPEHLKDTAMLYSGYPKTAIFATLTATSCYPSSAAVSHRGMDSAVLNGGCLIANRPNGNDNFRLPQPPPLFPQSQPLPWLHPSSGNHHMTSEDGSRQCPPLPQPMSWDYQRHKGL